MPDYERSVFVNCPLDEGYRHLFEAVVFTVYDCGYIARCALEVDDASEVRIDKITKIIGDCRFGIHDISRTEVDSATSLPRFNMPLDLGLFLGAKRFGRGQQKLKICLILDVEPFRYQKFISDVSGQDIAVHSGENSKAIRIVRDWLSSATPKAVRIPGGRTMSARYDAFRRHLPSLCKKVHLSIEELTFNDYIAQVEEWLKSAPAPASR
ncbi:MAG TPA: hypothetical protein VN380_00295 [Thermoanaerobaculia bacterium]|jgi:hypothetical protein|nr:hypothetical protein [Thermoanaerobaculia bacterium]